MVWWYTPGDKCGRREDTNFQASQISLLMEQLFKNKNFSLSLKPPALSCHHRKPAPKSSETTDINNESPPLLE